MYLIRFKDNMGINVPIYTTERPEAVKTAQSLKAANIEAEVFFIDDQGDVPTITKISDS